MANILVNSESINSFSNSVQDKINDLGSEFDTLNSLMSDAKELIDSNNGSSDAIDNIKDNINRLNQGFSDFNNSFLAALREILESYQDVDKDTFSNVSMLDDATMVATIGVGGLASGGFDFGKISSNANDASNNNFIAESKVHDSAFGEGEYTFHYREDGTVRIDKNGVAMGFTTQENADKITGGLKSKTDNVTPEVVPAETKTPDTTEEEKTLESKENVEDKKDDAAPLTPINEEKNAMEKETDKLNEALEKIKQKKEQDEVMYGNGPWRDLQVEKKKVLSSYKDVKIVQQTTYYEGSNKRTMVVLENGEYVVVPGGKVDKVGKFDTILLNPLSEEKANSMITYETKKKIYEYKNAISNNQA